MSRYSEITARAVHRLPERVKSRFGRRRIVYLGVAGVAVFIVLIGALAALLGDMIDGTPFSVALTSALWGAVGAATATLVALLLMPFIRDGLGLAEDIRLLEAASPTHPLMRELITRAPGTYTHSVATANLAEAAAEQIGADTLVTRVGAYYHDVGKIRRPAFFYENQKPGFNPHDQTKPQLSAAIITTHVQDGVALAEQYHLPKEVRDIILQHHGTTLVRYFFNKASALDAGAFEADFRYRGQKPQSREAALIMLADTSEAAVRALREPTEERVRGVVRTVTEEKFADGQLDDSGLTPTDMERMIEVYSQLLVSMYHARCEYPTIEELEKGAVDADQYREPSRV